MFKLIGILNITAWSNFKAPIPFLVFTNQGFDFFRVHDYFVHLASLNQLKPFPSSIHSQAKVGRWPDGGELRFQVQFTDASPVRIFSNEVFQFYSIPLVEPYEDVVCLIRDGSLCFGIVQKVIANGLAVIRIIGARIGVESLRRRRFQLELFKDINANF